MSEKFQPVQFEGGNELLLPTHIANPAAQEFMAPHEFRPDQQEMNAQKLVMGTPEAYGAGSIRNEDLSEVAEEQAAGNAAERLDRSIEDMLKPENVIELKAQLDHKVARANDEATHAIDKRHDKDGSKAAAEAERKATLKAELIDAYTQIGTKDGETRDVPKIVKSDISRLMDLSYDELEAKIEAQNKAKAAPVQPIPPKPPTTPEGGSPAKASEEAERAVLEKKPVPEAKPVANPEDKSEPEGDGGGTPPKPKRPTPSSPAAPAAAAKEVPQNSDAAPAAEASKPSANNPEALAGLGGHLELTPYEKGVMKNILTGITQRILNKSSEPYAFMQTHAHGERDDNLRDQVVYELGQIVNFDVDEQLNKSERAERRRITPQEKRALGLDDNPDEETIAEGTARGVMFTLEDVGRFAVDEFEFPSKVVDPNNETTTDRMNRIFSFTRLPDVPAEDQAQQEQEREESPPADKESPKRTPRAPRVPVNNSPAKRAPQRQPRARRRVNPVGWTQRTSD